MSYYPAGTDMSYFDDVSTEETEVEGTEEVECTGCGECFDVEPDGAYLEDTGEMDCSDYKWYAFKVECPHCQEVWDYGDCD